MYTLYAQADPHLNRSFSLGPGGWLYTYQEYYALYEIANFSKYSILSSNMNDVTPILGSIYFMANVNELRLLSSPYSNLHNPQLIIQTEAVTRWNLQNLGSPL